jgi:hypothetical protein
MAACPGPERLSEALRILDQSHPPIVTASAAERERQRLHTWSTTLSLGYDTNATADGGAAGTRANLAVTIPLFDPTSRIERADARAAAARDRDSKRAAFIADLTRYCTAINQRGTADHARQFARDRLAYYQERIDQGLDDPAVLWQQAEAFQAAERKHNELARQLDTDALALARQWGGDQWPRLHALLQAIRTIRP